MRMSEKLWEIPMGFSSCGPECHGIPRKVEAESPQEALRKAVWHMDIEWAFDLEGEWVEIQDGNGVLKYTFARNPRYEALVGEFEYRGLKLIGEYEETEGSDFKYPLSKNCILITCDGEQDIENAIWPWMPDWVINSTLDWIIGYEDEDGVEKGEEVFRAQGQGSPTERLSNARRKENTRRE